MFADCLQTIRLLFVCLYNARGGVCLSDYVIKQTNCLFVFV
jgi:hypothetical protein